MSVRDDLASLYRLADELPAKYRMEAIKHLQGIEARVRELEREREQNKHKVEAYDAARATVKTEGNTRAYYVLRAEAAEAALAEKDAELVRWQKSADPAYDLLAETVSGMLDIEHAIRNGDLTDAEGLAAFRAHLAAMDEQAVALAREVPS